MASTGRRARPGRGCDVAIDTGDPALPVVGRGQLAGVRRSTNSRRRAAVLLAVHVIIAAHIAHFVVAGRTLSPVEPSESMYTLELGQVNAGFIFLAVALLGTLIFGRFFCGWGCHIVALQDLCAWIMKRLGVRPRPFRSRLLLWAPAALAFYMFFWPTLRRLLFAPGAASFPGLTSHLTTDAFWRTFPTPLWAALTFVSCGFAAVYLLGAKGFCTYGCPYGALFGAFDRLSPARIVVSDACEQCGHCTATCTSNVLVHEEVRRYGMVVDPGCMKCMDCVSVCPKGALSFGFARPSLFRGRPADERVARRFALGLGEELILGAVCLAGTLAFRGLYDRFPLLMSLGLGGITAFLALKLWQLVRGSAVRLQNLNLKVAGKVTAPGVAFATVAALWLAFAAHSGFVQWQRVMGRYQLNRTEATRADVLSGEYAQRNYSERHREAAEKSFQHFLWADRWGLLDVVEVKLGLAWGYLLRGDLPEAERQIRAAVAVAPEQRGLRDDLIAVLGRQGRLSDALQVVADRLKAFPATAGDYLQYSGLLLEAGRYDEAVAQLDAAQPLAERDADTLFKLGAAYVVVGRPEQGLAALRRSAELSPREPERRFRLAGVLVDLGRNEEAIEQYRACLELAPDAAAAHFNLGALLRRLGRQDEAIEELSAAQRLAPQDIDSRIELGLAYMAARRDAEALETFQEALALDPAGTQAQLQLPKLIEEVGQRLARR